MSAEAILYEKEPEEAVSCHLCAHHCRIQPGKRGICQVRENRHGTLYSLVYGRVIAEHVDPIEKKPLYHFHPGSMSYSVATAGCNLSCDHCQNYQISKEAARLSPIPGKATSPGEILQAALSARCRSISYTYTEPTVFMEFALECARLAKGKGLGNVFVTNGFMSEAAADLASGFLDAANIDLKGATDEHYRKVCGGRLKPVLETIERLYEKGVWIEVTTLVIPGLNDDPASIEFIASFISSVDPAIPWHVSAFFPTYRMLDRPPTPLETLERAAEIGRKAGLRYIYLGNVHRNDDDTRCPGCGQALIERSRYMVKAVNVTDSNRCGNCGAEFDGKI
jgi:pyruvate formate lyase activating enzyme